MRLGQQLGALQSPGGLATPSLLDALRTFSGSVKCCAMVLNGNLCEGVDRLAQEGNLRRPHVAERSSGAGRGRGREQKRCIIGH
jgi:hypothetical protein